MKHRSYYTSSKHKLDALFDSLAVVCARRSTFRRISQDTGKFVRFANGLMNESNSLVASVMEKLPEVRAVQLQMRDPAQWGGLTEEQRNEITERWVGR